MLRAKMLEVLATDGFHTEEEKRAFADAFVKASKPYGGRTQRDMFE